MNLDSTTSKPTTAGGHPLSRVVLLGGTAVLLLAVLAIGGILLSQRRALAGQADARRRAAEAGPLTAACLVSKRMEQETIPNTGDVWRAEQERQKNESFRRECDQHLQAIVNLWNKALAEGKLPKII